VPDKEAQKLIGNYWPYATTVFDYIRRAMPWQQPKTLSDNEVLTNPEDRPYRTVFHGLMCRKSSKRWADEQDAGSTSNQTGPVEL
jgi:hypothetical protein